MKERLEMQASLKIQKCRNRNDILMSYIDGNYCSMNLFEHVLSIECLIISEYL